MNFNLRSMTLTIHHISVKLPEPCKISTNYAISFQVTFDGEENVVDFFRLPVDHIEQGVTVASTEDHQDNRVTSTTGPGVDDKE